MPASLWNGTAYNLAGHGSATPATPTSNPPPPSTAPAALVGDVSGDGGVDVFDQSALLSAWGASGPSDLNHDGVMNIFDL